MKELTAHMVGDYLLQSDWMARHKTVTDFAAAVHAAAYSLPFLALKPSKTAYALILGSHYAIDRYRLARYVIWAKNFLAPLGEDHTLTHTGMPKSTPIWLATWLLILTDNLIHCIINWLAMNRFPRRV
jgi:hypothetical protein